VLELSEEELPLENQFAIFQLGLLPPPLLAASRRAAPFGTRLITNSKSPTRRRPQSKKPASHSSQIPWAAWLRAFGGKAMAGPCLIRREKRHIRSLIIAAKYGTFSLTDRFSAVLCSMREVRP
jgi:hypothetical protein